MEKFMEVESKRSVAALDPSRNNKAYKPKTDNCRGALCPNCRQVKLDYNGMLELICPNCGYREPGGAFT